MENLLPGKASIILNVKIDRHRSNELPEELAATSAGAMRTCKRAWPNITWAAPTPINASDIWAAIYAGASLRLTEAPRVFRLRIIWHDRVVAAQFLTANDWANRCNGPNIGDNRTPLIVEIHRN